MFDKTKTCLKAVQEIVDEVTAILDLSGGFWLAAFTGSIIYRILYGPTLGVSEAAVYSAAIGAYAASNIAGPKGPGQA
jgi:hypothetical protein